ncbi:MAG TPA: family 20 glycosylhydrolase [Armatimonadota bacterium]|nr:family 20 glycosylhydrolase [Armatimonadota bacterium]
MVEQASWYLAPSPQQIAVQAGAFRMADKRYTQLLADEPQTLLMAGQSARLPYAITASPVVPAEQVGLVIRLDPMTTLQREGYRLTIEPNGISIVAADAAGAFYGACTLVQLVQQCPEELPCLVITDWPDFPARGVMLDISRDMVPTQESLYQLVDLLASWKINQFQLYTEHTFAYSQHPTVWQDASPMTPEEILALDAYCKARFIELVPNQNSFGHMERWLKFPEYTHLAEAPNGSDTPWNTHFDGPFGLAAANPESIKLLAGLYDELLPHFSSRLLNVGCDETFDLGQGYSKALCEEKGTGRVYLDFLKQIHDEAHKRGRTIMFWGDIIMHHPELIPEIPQDSIILEWGYEAHHPFQEHGAQFHASGIPFYVCPGASNWCSLCGRTENVIGNITNAARSGKANGAQGVLNTSWGDHGHWDPLPTAYLGFLAGACASWNTTADLRDHLAEKLSRFAFADATDTLGRVYYDLGNLYQAFHEVTENCTIPFLLLFRPTNDPVSSKITNDELDEMERRLHAIASMASTALSTAPDAACLRDEVRYLINLMQLSVDAGRIRLGGMPPADWAARVESIRREHRQIWLLRNRPGGLDDSTNRLQAPVIEQV